MDGLDEALAKVFPRMLDEMLPSAVERIMRDKAFQSAPLKNGQKLTEVGFAWEIAFEFIRNGMDVWQARDTAFDALRTFLKDEKVAFGNPDYDWGPGGAVTLAHEEMEYWEPAA